MLRKGAIAVSDPKEDQFISFLIRDKYIVYNRDKYIVDQGKHPVVNLKDLNSNIPYQHFQMEGLFLLKNMLLPGDKMCKTDLKEVYFAISFSVKSRMYVRVQWKGLECKLFCLCIELSSAPLVFTKLFKVLISLS